MKRIFISYSHKDKKWKDRLVKHLRVLEREGFCHLWHDRKIGLGNDWDPEIENALNKADVAVLVISPDFLDSDFTREKEIPRIRERRETGELTVVPLFLKPCAWEEVAWLEQIQGYPTDGETLIKGSEYDIDERMAAFVKEIARFVKGEKKQISFTNRLPGTTDTMLLTPLPSRKIDLIGRQEDLKW